MRPRAPLVRRGGADRLDQVRSSRSGAGRRRAPIRRPDSVIAAAAPAGLAGAGAAHGEQPGRYGVAALPTVRRLSAGVAGPSRPAGRRWSLAALVVGTRRRRRSGRRRSGVRRPAGSSPGRPAVVAPGSGSAAGRAAGRRRRGSGRAGPRRGRARRTGCGGGGAAARAGRPRGCRRG